MFSFISKKSRSVILVLAVAFVAAFFTGCPAVEPEEAGASITGTWVSSYNEVFEISDSTVVTYGINATGAKAWDSYEGDSVVISPIDSTSGYIYIKYTKAACPTHSDYANYIYAYDTDSEAVGKYYALYYSELTATSSKIAAAYGTVPCTLTLDEAKETFTVANGYFGGFSECVRK